MGKVRLRNLKDSESAWRDYKAVRLGGIYYGGFFQDNLALIDFVRCQPLIHPLVWAMDMMGSGIYFRLRPHQSDGKFWIGIILKKISTRWVDRSSD